MKKFLAIYIGTASALEKSGWNKLDEEKRKKLQQSGIKAWMEWGEAHKQPSSIRGAPSEDEAGELTRRCGHQEQHDRLRNRAGGIARGRCKDVREASAFYDLPWRLGRDHGVSAASRAVRRD